MCPSGLPPEGPNFILSDFTSEDDEQAYADEINRIGESLHDNSTDCRGLFTKLKSTVAVRIEEAFDDFTGSVFISPDTIFSYQNIQIE